MKFGREKSMNRAASDDFGNCRELSLELMFYGIGLPRNQSPTISMRLLGRRH